jgi:hypothetical protein
MLKTRESLTSYARTRYNIAATNTQQGLIKYTQELQEDNLHTQMSNIIKKSR